MYSVLLLLLGLLPVPLLVAGVGWWRRRRATILVFPLVVLAGAMLEALLAGAGRWLGAGPVLQELYAFPMLITIFVLPMTLFTFATLARRAGFRWAQPDWGHGAVCILAVLLLLAGLPAVLALKAIGPACWEDVVWYLHPVPAGLSCPGAETPAAGGDSLVAGLTFVTVLLAWLGHGAGVWRREGWPWLALAMVTGAVLVAVPWTFGPLPRLTGQLVMFSAMVMATLRYVRAVPAGTVGDAQAVAVTGEGNVRHD